MPTDANGNELLEIEEIAVSDGGAAHLVTIDVTSGEEKFNVVWEQAGKLLRFDEGENAWKERGQGTAKVMQRKDKPDHYMFIFRREGVGKIGAQHYLIKGTVVKIHPTSAKSVLWSAAKDYSDHAVGYPETFVLRLPSKDIARTAVEKMNEAIEKSGV